MKKLFLWCFLGLVIINGFGCGNVVFAGTVVGLETQHPVPYTIVIDPGHGGEDPGAIGRAGTQEKNITLHVSKYLAQRLAALGFGVVLTRHKDVFISLARRTEITVEANADLFVSIHANAVRSRSPVGFEVYYLKDMIEEEKWLSQRAEKIECQGVSSEVKKIIADLECASLRSESAQLAQQIADRVREGLCEVKIRGIKNSQFYVLRQAQIPAVLIELGFISHATEEVRLADPMFQRTIAGLIAKAIGEYSQHKKKFF